MKLFICCSVLCRSQDQAWPRLLKEEVFLNTMPVKYNKGQLFVYLPHASQLQDVIFLRNHAKRVNRFFDESWVLEVRLTLDKNSIPSRNY